MKFGKQIIKEILKMFGLELHWIRPSPPLAMPESAIQIASSLKKFEIDLVLDVGANKGQFAPELRMRISWKNRLILATYLSSRRIIAGKRWRSQVGRLSALHIGRS